MPRMPDPLSALQMLKVIGVDPAFWTAVLGTIVFREPLNPCLCRVDFEAFATIRRLRPRLRKLDRVEVNHGWDCQLSALYRNTGIQCAG